MTNIKGNAPILILPGETLIDLLEEKGMTQAELAERMGRPLKTINEIIKGKTSITPETAIQLEGVFSVPASFWMNLESNYQVALVRFNFEEKLKEEYKIAEKYPYKEMIKLNWMPGAKDAKEIVQSLLSFFGVISLKNVKARIWKIPPYLPSIMEIVKGRLRFPGMITQKWNPLILLLTHIQFKQIPKRSL